MRIVVLDGYTLNPGDLSWDGLKSLGNCTFHDRTPPDLTVERARQADAVFTNKVVLGRSEIGQLPALRYVGVLATGYNVVDVAAARERGIVVTNVPNYGTSSVAQMTFALLLELTQRVGHHAGSVRSGRWSTNRDFCYWDYPLVELAGLTMGLVGLGRIGRSVAAVASAFGMRVTACDPAAGADAPVGVRMADMETVFATSDVVSLHCPLTAESRGLVSAARLARMKSTAFLINTARGPLVNETDLAAALNAGRIAGAGLDVLGVEPPVADNPLLMARNCLITPHIAWATASARRRLMATAIGNLEAFMAGRSENVVTG
jgi:glycerate dehydrogenase